MAVAITQTANPAGASNLDGTATYSTISIGTASSDRIVVVCVTAEFSASSPTGVTIDYGSGATSMTAGSLGNQGNVYARIFYLAVPTGTTATFVVTFGGFPDATDNHITVYSVTGASTTLNASNNDASTDMDSTDPLTTGSITIPTDGGFLAVAAGATDSVAKTWANATEDVDADAGTYRHTTAYSTTPGTVTVTCTGTTNGEDGALSWVVFDPSGSAPTNTSNMFLMFM